MSDISISLSLGFDDGVQDGGIASGTIALDFGVTPLFEDTVKVMSGTFSDISLPVVGWTNATWLAFINRSETDGEDIYLAAVPYAVAGGTDDGTFDGTALGNTLTGAGYFKQCTVAGTSQGKTWAIGDIAVYLGSSGTYLQLRPKKITLKPGEVAVFRITGDGDAWMARALTGTPYLGFVVLGTLDE